jgi:hypothetical protein
MKNGKRNCKIINAYSETKTTFLLLSGSKNSNNNVKTSNNEVLCK